ncbi:cilia- and flagella-associated protein 53 [Anopheles bellator]|uniref:cilia- and flagella-associated protein 53 n=1 Tax=Anopheles bellator TaxID=139047 RepID=UPI00264889D4|nr:cilia- and flagella-associated protein 53 [Anopheles bellator]
MLFYPEISIQNELKKLMALSDQAYDYQLEQKRKRLQALLQAEEEQLDQEIMQKLGQEEETRLREKQNALLVAKQDHERQRAEFVKNKMIQLQLNNCDEIRSLLQQQYHEESKKCQLAQIEDKMKLKQAKMDEERMWTDVHIRKYKNDLEQELSKKRERKLMEQKTLQDIKVQINDKVLQAEQEKVNLQRVVCAALPFPDHDPKLKTIGKAELAEKLREQITFRKELQRKQNDQDRQVIRILNETMARELEQEKIALKTEEEVLRKQKDQFYQYSKDVHRQRLVEEGKLEKLIKDTHEKFDRESVEKCVRDKQKRLQLASLTYEGQRNQIAEMEARRVRERDERQQEALREREFQEKNRQEAELADCRIQTAVHQYRDSLKEQIKSANLERERSKRANQMETNRMIERSLNELNFVQSYVKGSFEAHFKKHPNVSLMKRKY